MWRIYLIMIFSFLQQPYCVSYFEKNQQGQSREGVKFNDKYLLSRVMEYDQDNQLLYVLMDFPGSDFDVYAIDVKNKKDKLITIGWSFYNLFKPERIVGGNSRVLVEATKNQFWFDTKNQRKNALDPTIYERVNISSLTSLPIYSQSSRCSNFLSSFFQYFSLSSDKLNMTTFLFTGYSKNSLIVGSETLKSNAKPIKTLSDKQRFFLAMADNDVYASTVIWNSATEKYDLAWGKLSYLKIEESKREQYLRYFYSGIYATFINNIFVILTQDGEFFLFSFQLAYGEIYQSPSIFGIGFIERWEIID